MKPVADTLTAVKQCQMKLYEIKMTILMGMQKTLLKFQEILQEILLELLKRLIIFFFDILRF